MSKKNLSRRDFLRMSGAAGAAVAGGLSPLANLSRVAAQTDATVNVLTVGDPWDLALQSVVDQFTEATGIGVNIESLGYTAFASALDQRLPDTKRRCRCHRRRPDVDQPICRQRLDPLTR